MISGVSKVVVPVDDQERARDFWTTKLGFEVVRDESYGDERWVEVRPPDGSPVVVLSPLGPPQRATRSPTSCRIAGPLQLPGHRGHLPQTQGARREVPGAAGAVHFGWWALFEDDDGTRYALGQWD